MDRRQIVVEVVGQTSQYNSAMAGASASTAKFELAVGAAIVGIAALGAKLAQVSVSAASSFQMGMARVRGVTGATERDFRKLRSEAERLGSVTEFTMLQITAGLEALGRAGLKPHEMIAAMSGVVALASSQTLTLAESARIVTRILGGFSLAAKHTDRVVNVLAATAMSANLNVQELGMAFTVIAPLANVLGESLEDVSAVIGALADVGLVGTRGTTALATALSRLAVPTAAMEKKIGQLGISAWDAQGQFVGLINLVSQLEYGLMGLSDQQRAAAIATIFGQESFRHWAALVETGGDNLRELRNTITGTNTAFRLQDYLLAQASGAWVLLTSSVDLLWVTLGTPVLDVATRGLTYLRRIVTMLTDRIKELAPYITAAFGTLYQYLSDSRKAIGFFILQAVQLAGFVGIIGAISLGFKMLLSKIMLLTLAASTLYIAWMSNLFGIQKAVENFTAFMGRIITAPVRFALTLTGHAEMAAQVADFFDTLAGKLVAAVAAIALGKWMVKGLVAGTLIGGKVKLVPLLVSGAIVWGLTQSTLGEGPRFQSLLSKIFVGWGAYALGKWLLGGLLGGALIGGKIKLAPLVVAGVVVWEIGQRIHQPPGDAARRAAKAAATYGEALEGFPTGEMFIEHMPRESLWQRTRNFLFGEDALPEIQTAAAATTLAIDGITEAVEGLGEAVDALRGPFIEVDLNALSPIKRRGGGDVPGFGQGDTVPAMLEPGEFVVPNWMMRIGWLSRLLKGIWGRGKRMAAGGPVGAGGAGVGEDSAVLRLLDGIYNLLKPHAQNREWLSEFHTNARLLIENTEELGGNFAVLVEKAKAQAETTTQAITEIEAMAEASKEAAVALEATGVTWKQAFGETGAALDSLRDVVGRLPGHLGSVASASVNLVKALASGTATIPTMISLVLQAILSFMQKGLEALEERKAELEETIDVYIHAFRQASQAMGDFLGFLGPIGTVLGATADAFVASIHLLTLEGLDSLRAAVNLIINYVRSIVAVFSSLIRQSEAYQAVQNEGERIWQAVADLFGQFLWPLAAVLRGVLDWLGLQREANDALAEAGVVRGWRRERRVYQAAAPGQFRPRAVTAIPAWAVELVEGIVGGITNWLQQHGIADWAAILDSFRASSVRVWQNIERQLPGILASIQRMANAIWQGIFGPDGDGQSLLEAIESAIRWGVNWLVKDAPDAVDRLIEFSQLLWELAGSFWNWILRQDWTKIWESIRTKFDQVSALFEDITDFVGVRDDLHKTTEAINALRTNMVLAVSIAAGAIVGGIGGALIPLTAGLSAVGAAGGMLAGGLLGGVIGTMIEGGAVPPAPSPTAPQGEGPIELLAGLLDRILNGVAGIVPGVGGFIMDGVRGLTGLLSQLLGGIVNVMRGLGNFLAGLLGRIVNIAGGLVAGISSVVMNGFHQIAGLAKSLAGGVVRTVNGAATALRGAVNWVGDLANRGWRAASRAAHNVTNGVNWVARTIGGVVGNIAGEMSRFIAGLFETAAGGIVGFIRGVIGAIGRFFGFREGGIVPGGVGVPQLILAHGGEEVVTFADRKQRGGGDNVAQILKIAFAGMQQAFHGGVARAVSDIAKETSQGVSREIQKLGRTIIQVQGGITHERQLLYATDAPGTPNVEVRVFIGDEEMTDMLVDRVSVRNRELTGKRTSAAVWGRRG